MTEIRTALDELDALRKEDRLDYAMRILLIDHDDIDSALLDLRDMGMPLTTREELISILELIDGLDRESLTTLLLSFSLCPLHEIDYAICFDDDNPECAQIRAIHDAYDS